MDHSGIAGLFDAGVNVNLSAVLIRMRPVFLVVAAACALALMPPPAASAQDAGPDKGQAAGDPGDPSGRRDTSNERPSQAEMDELAQRARRDGRVRAILGLRMVWAPEGSLTGEQVAAQRATIAEERAALGRDLQGSGHREVRAFQTVPYVVMELPERAVEALQRSNRVATADTDDLLFPTLADSSPLVQASNMWDAGFTGSGFTVAVLDTGTDRAHPFLGNRVVEEACYSTTDAASSTTSVCPNGSSSQTGPGSGVHCSANGCEHGTHVSGIVAGSGATSAGVGRAANLMSVQVFSQLNSVDSCSAQGYASPCTTAFLSDVLSGLERVYAVRGTRPFAAVNMSLGGGKFTSHCDDNPLKPIIDNLASANIATIIATGNAGFTDGVSQPACISTAVAVGSTTKSDEVSSFSNGHPTMVDLLAPGSDINSSVPGGGFSSFNGTSMATPQVAGAWALMRQHTPSASVATVLNALKTTGLSVNDTRFGAGYSHPRIRVYQAAFGEAPPGPAGDNFADPIAIEALPFTRTQTTVGTTFEPGEPPACGSLSIGSTVWFSYTPPINQTLTADTFGSGFDTILAAYTGSSLGSLTEVACNDDDGGLQSRVSFEAAAGTTYYFQAGGWGGDNGSLTFNMTGSPDAPPPGEKKAIADFDGDGDTDIAIFRPSNGRWYLRGVANSIPYGTTGDIPVPGDYDGDGTTDIAIFRPSNGRWYLRGVPSSIPWGFNGDLPVPGDYDGDGTTDIAVYRPYTGQWHIRGVASGINWGTASDIPVVLPAAIHRSAF